MNDLEIPERAIVALGWVFPTERELEGIRIIVAAELRRIAPPSRMGIVNYRAIQRRANELDPEES